MARALGDGGHTDTGHRVGLIRSERPRCRPAGSRRPQIRETAASARSHPPLWSSQASK